MTDQALESAIMRSAIHQRAARDQFGQIDYDDLVFISSAAERLGRRMRVKSTLETLLPAGEYDARSVELFDTYGDIRLRVHLVFETPKASVSLYSTVLLRKPALDGNGAVDWEPFEFGSWYQWDWCEYPYPEAQSEELRTEWYALMLTGSAPRILDGMLKELTERLHERFLRIYAEWQKDWEN